MNQKIPKTGTRRENSENLEIYIEGEGWVSGESYIQYLARENAVVWMSIQSSIENNLSKKSALEALVIDLVATNLDLAESLVLQYERQPIVVTDLKRSILFLKEDGSLQEETESDES